VLDNDAVTVIGAGPAGLTAAIVLRRHGVPVRVFDKSPNVGHRFKGDFQGLENWSSEDDVTEWLGEMGVEINFPCAPYYRGTLYAPRMWPAEVTSERPMFYLVRRGPMRGTLDTGLKEQALGLGAEIVFNRRIDDFEGRAVVGAGPVRADVVALGLTFNTSMYDRAVAVLNDDIAPRGYAYFIVNRGMGAMATVLYDEFKRGEECFEKMKRFFKEKLDPDVRDEKRFGGFGNFFLGNTQVRQGGLHVGESAGFQDCLWSFGIRHAMLSGCLAARSLIEGLDYDRLWKTELRPMLETSLVNRYLVEMFGSSAYRYLAKKLARGNPCGFLMKHYNPSALKRLLLPLAKRRYESRIESRNSGRGGSHAHGAG
jgi:flavin-dependent dehydrogenase